MRRIKMLTMSFVLTILFSGFVFGKKSTPISELLDFSKNKRAAISKSTSEKKISAFKVLLDRVRLTAENLRKQDQEKSEIDALTFLYMLEYLSDADKIKNNEKCESAIYNIERDKGNEGQYREALAWYKLICK